MPRTRRRPTQIALATVDSVVAVTALGGGAMLALGFEDDRFPAAWLTGTPFRSYAIPGLILAGAVGGSAVAAAAASVRSLRAGGLASVISGSVLLGWIAGGVAILSRRRPEIVSPMELLYLATGMATIGLGLRAQRASRVTPERGRR